MTYMREAYQALIKAGTLQPDPAQAGAVELLHVFSQNLPQKRTSKWFGSSKALPQNQGVYLWGRVGRGKSMLMDLAYEHIGIHLKRRIHFHDFMQEIHDFIDRWRKLSDTERRKAPCYHRSDRDDPIPAAARHIALKAEFLCFDEFEVIDIADAMLLGRLFTHLFAEGVAIIATSNRHPDELYKDGINRQLFLPFIDLLKSRLKVFELVADRDYRLDQLQSQPTYYAPLNKDTVMAFDVAWQKVTLYQRTEPAHIIVKGRRLDIPAQASGCARFDFDSLCAQPLGVGDYLSIARQFHTLAIDAVPILDDKKQNEARRFIALIDVLYETGTKLLIRAAALPNRLCPEGREAFAFERTASRLYEMQSEAYLAKQKTVTIDRVLGGFDPSVM